MSTKVFQLFVVVSISLLLLTGQTQAKDTQQVYDFDWRDHRYHKKQTQLIKDIAREQFAAQLRQEVSDLPTLQRIIYKGVIPKNDTEQLQALGASLGNVMAKEFNLEWKIYEDKIGRSRALCVPDSRECLFPITMLSRRIEVGLLPDVQKIYNDAFGLIKPYLKTSPYEVTKK